MPLVSIVPELIQARNLGYAIPSFNVFEPHAVDGLISALQKSAAPCIFGVYSGCLKEANIRAFAAYLRERVAHLQFPASIMLDHGETLEQVQLALDLGFTDVMIDASRLPFEDNIAKTREVVQLARHYGAGVEAELGHVGLGDQYNQFGAARKGFTDPRLVTEFVEKTGVDFLAIAFGNAHGEYQSEPRLDLELVREVRNTIAIPLVMHGGTGLTDDQYREVIRAGISKINYFTGLNKAATARMIRTAAEPGATMFGILSALREAYEETCIHYLEVFGAAGRALPTSQAS